MIWDWELGVLAFALGLGIGFLLTWQMLPGSERNSELKKELDEARAELTAYRDKVTQHFQTSATLFEDMHERYRAVYQHLASSSQELCAEHPEGLQLDPDAMPRLPISANQTDPEAKAPSVSTLERERRSDNDDSFGDAPNIPELTEEVDVTMDANADKKSSASA